MDEHETDRRIARRLAQARSEQNLTLEALAERSGVSRAMISKIERGEASPTAALLGRLCAGLGLSLSQLFAAETEQETAEPLARFADQLVWRDPETGYLRRNVSPTGTGSPIEIVEVSFPPGARVTYDQPWQARRIDQQIWVLDGVLELHVSGIPHRLESGDCLHMRLDGPIMFHNPGDRPVRYAVLLTMLPGSAQPSTQPQAFRPGPNHAERNHV